MSGLAIVHRLASEPQNGVCNDYEGAMLDLLDAHRVLVRKLGTLKCERIAARNRTLDEWSTWGPEAAEAALALAAQEEGDE